MIWVNLIFFVASFLLTALLAPRPKFEDARMEDLDNLSFPQSDEGSPIAVLLGRRRITGPNTLWWGDLTVVPIKKTYKTSLFTSQTVIVGYRYFVGLDLGLCLGPDAHLRRIWLDKDAIWAGDIGPAETAIEIDLPDLFGGIDGGGGFVAGPDITIKEARYDREGNLIAPAVIEPTGPLRFYGGSYTQVVNSYLDSVLATAVPAYNGLAHIVFEKVYIGTSPYLRPFSFEVERYPSDLGLTSEVVRVGDDLNPMEALYQILISDWGGLGVNPLELDLANFRAAAQVLKNEGNGISLLITRPNTGASIIEEILRQVDGILYPDPTTGLIRIKLIRKDYDPLSIPDFDETSVRVVRTFNRSSWADTLNQIRVIFPYRGTTADHKYEDSVALAQDMANISVQGRIRSATVSFPGCTEPLLAVQLATRELAQWSVPLYNVTLEINRKAGVLRPGDVFKLSWPAYGISDLVMRVQRFDLGELVDGRVVVDAVQDKFAVNQVVYGTPPPPIWTPIDGTALAIGEANVVELPYWLLAHSGQDFLEIPAADVTYALAMARSPSSLMLGYDAVMSDTNWATQVLGLEKAPFMPTARLNADLPRATGYVSGSIPAGIAVKDLDPAGFLTGNVGSLYSLQNYGANLVLINNELFGFTGVTDNGNGTWQLTGFRRALLDTDFQDHLEDDTVYFLIDFANLVLQPLEGSATYKTRFLSVTNTDKYPFASASDVTRTMNRRLERPMAPDYITLGGVRSTTQTVANGPHTFGWQERSRLDAVIRLEDDGTQTPEAGVTYNLYLYVNDVVRDSAVGVTGVSHILSSAGFSGTGRFEIEAVRDGLISFMRTKYLFTIT